MPEAMQDKVALMENDLEAVTRSMHAALATGDKDRAHELSNRAQELSLMLEQHRRKLKQVPAP